MSKKIKDTYTMTGGMVYTKKQVEHLRDHVTAKNWEELKSKLTNPDTAKTIKGFIELDDTIIYTYF